jgi:serine/threonine-protein kinase
MAGTGTTDSMRIAAAMPDYDVERELGRGGMGVVYLGRHRRLDRGVAIKELPPSFAADPEVRERFSTEARTLAGLSHPHIVPIFDYVEREGLCLIVMEQLPGGTVWDRFTTTGLTPPTACAITMACCAALEHAHSKGVLHLDVKPDNLMFDSESAIKVTDFGIARVISGDRTMGTVNGQVLGTPAYMSPEQARGEELSPTSDVYATGVMLYELLSGQLPWVGATSASELLAQRLKQDPIPLSEVAPHVPPLLADVVMRAISRDVTQRYPRAEELGVAIGEACGESWGPTWLDHAGVAIVGSERLTRAARTTGTRPGSGPIPPAGGAERITGAGPAGATIARGSGGGLGGATVTGPAAPAIPGAGETSVVGDAAAVEAHAHETIQRGAAISGGAAPATSAAAPVGAPVGAPAAGAAPAAAPAAAPVLPDFQVVRAVGAEPRIQGADLYDLELADLIGVEDVLRPPKQPWRAISLTAACFLAAAGVAVVGIGSPSRQEALVPGQVQIDGRDVAIGRRLHLDLSRNVVVRVDDPVLLARTDEVELTFSYLGVPVDHMSAPLLTDGTAEIDPGIGQRIVGGDATATVALHAGDDVLEHDLGIQASQTWYLTLPFAAAALAVLLSFANLESSLKPLRSGRSRRLSYVGALLSGAMLGASLVLVSGALGLREPTVPSLVGTGALGAVAGVAAARARLGIARRRRVRKAVRRAEKTLGVRATVA